MIVVILDVIAGIFWAFVCGEEVRKKNYDPTAWYVLGFIFGGLAYLVAWWFIKPKIKEVDKVDIERIVQADKARAMKGDIEAGRVCMSVWGTETSEGYFARGSKTGC